MIEKTERADAVTRARITAEDLRYTGVARHPLARQWMLKRLIESQEKAEAADSNPVASRWHQETRRIAGELRRCGMNIGKDV